MVLLINCFIVFLFILAANYYDLKFGIIPNKISLALFAYGLVFNLILAILYENHSILLFCLALTAFSSLISFVLWHIGFWGGGDLKLFIGMSLSLSFLDFNYLDKLDFLKYDDFIHYLNLPIFNQFVFYPKVFSVLLNAILISFIFLSAYVLFKIIKDKKLKYYSILTILDFSSMFNQISTESISINELYVSMVLDRYYFLDKRAFDIINSKNEDFINLKAFEDDDGFYFSSSNRMGLTDNDISLINDLYENGLIENPNFQIKTGIPFVPFLTLGYLGFLIFGDFISLISSFIRLFF